MRLDFRHWSEPDGPSSSLNSLQTFEFATPFEEDSLCFKYMDPIGSGDLPGFRRGYLTGCAILMCILAIELIVLL
jgi:hypothetical protein